MFSRRYTIIVADRTSGVVRRVTISVRPTLLSVCAVMALPILIGMGAAWKAKSDVAGLQAIQATLELENANYRAATNALAGQIESLQTAISDVGARSALDPNVARAMEKLPSLVKARAMGGGTEVHKSAQTTLSVMTSPEDTFGLLRMLLTAIESGLDGMRLSVERRNALAAATPSIWPAQGWLTSRPGARRDPVTGETEFHSGLDIAGDKGQPVYATAAGTVVSASYQGAYGKLIVIDHDFGLTTRYGHLLDFRVKAGDQVKRGDVIGRVGATGRATGYHLHYEVLANGKLLNPLQLLTQVPRTAN
jgi:murein DD-endopeptidase MepM/ murein hydrolase activator NlpD